jgi:hypothetical protein
MEFLLRTVARMASAGYPPAMSPAAMEPFMEPVPRNAICSVIFDPYCLLRSCRGAHAARTTGFVI